MVKNYGIAGQVLNTGGVDLLLEVGLGKQFVSSSLVVCNQLSDTVNRFSVMIVKAGTNYENGATRIFNNYKIDPDDTKPFVLGFTLSQNDKVFVTSELGGVSFNLFGATIG